MASRDHENRRRRTDEDDDDRPRRRRRHGDEDDDLPRRRRRDVDDEDDDLPRRRRRDEDDDDDEKPKKKKSKGSKAALDMGLMLYSYRYLAMVVGTALIGLGLGLAPVVATMLATRQSVGAYVGYGAGAAMIVGYLVTGAAVLIGLAGSFFLPRMPTKLPGTWIPWVLIGCESSYLVVSILFVIFRFNGNLTGFIVTGVSSIVLKILAFVFFMLLLRGIASFLRRQGIVDEINYLIGQYIALEVLYPLVIVILYALGEKAGVWAQVILLFFGLAAGIWLSILVQGRIFNVISMVRNRL